MYLTYDVYTSMGGTLDSAAFTRLCSKATALIDRLTHNRIQGEETVRTNVQYCCFELINAFSADETLSGGSGREIASVNNDGVSVSYAGTSSSGGSSLRNARIVRDWLDNEVTSTGLRILYTGVDL